jgi:uncharacterized membrane protein
MPVMLEKEYLGSPDNPRTAAVICYFTFIGWLIAYFAIYRNDKDSLAAYHLRQSLLIHIILFLIYLLSFLSSRGFADLMYACWFILWVWGFINALNEQKKPIPFIGYIAQSLFKKI